MKNIILCIFAFAVANFGSEYFIHDIPSYEHAAVITWNQFVAVSIFYYIWVRS